MPAMPESKGKFKKQLKVKDLIYKHQQYIKNEAEWTFVMALYEGIKEIKRLGLILQHEREPKVSYGRRIDELFSLGYSKSIVEIFHFFLFKKQAVKTLGTLHENKLWGLFNNDADLYGNTLDTSIMEIALYAGIQGHMGVLVDKAQGDFKTKGEAIDAKVYPYIAKYFPKAILDWKYDKKESSRPYLSYLKLLDDNGQYRIWTEETWEIWELPKNSNGEPDSSNEEKDGVFIGSGGNPIGIIPFVWHYNQKSRYLGIGNSDIHEVARIDLSIIRNMSQIEEIVYFAAFPMMRKPMRDASPIEINAPQQDDEVSVKQVLEFDPEKPESKPDWLVSEVESPVRAALSVVERKVSEIYRAANIGGMAATEPTKNAQSGVAKIIDFQLLNSKLVSKAINLETTENKIMEFWLRWENLWEQYKETVKISRNRTYDIENIAADLENSLTAKTLVISDTFNKLLQKQAVRQILPTATEKQLVDIDEEIDENVDNPPDPFGEDLFEDEDEETKGIIDKGMEAEKKGKKVFPFKKGKKVFPFDKSEKEEE